MRLASTTGDFMSFCNRDAVKAVQAFEGTGFKHIDFSFYRMNYENSPFMSDDWVKEIASVSKAAEKLGFDFVQAHSPSNDYFCDDKDVVIKGNIRAIEACAYLGIDKLVVHSGRSRDLIFPQDWKAYINGVKEFYEALYPAIEKYNVRVLAENYTPSSRNECSFYNADDLNELLDACNHPLMGVCWDVGHGNLLNPDQMDDIIKLGERLQAVHIQDNMGVHDNHLCPYMGTLDVDAVMQGLKENGFIDRGGIFTFECDNIVSRTSSWNNHKHMINEKIAADPDLEVKRAAIRLMYEIGKSILTKYDCFED